MRAFFVNLSPTLLSVLVIAAFFILGFGLLYGFAAIIKGIEPLLLAFIGFSILLFILCVLPCSLVKKLRGRMAVYAAFLSAVCGGCTWLISFMYIFLYLKAWVFLFIWLFQVSAPLAVVLLLSNAQYAPAVFLAIAFVSTFGMRFFSAWLAAKSAANQEVRTKGGFSGSDDVFEAEVVDRGRAQE